MSIQRIVISTISIFVFVVLFGMIYHGYLLETIYHQTSHLWRSQEAIKAHGMWVLLSDVLYGFLFSYLYDRYAKGVTKGFKQAVEFGFWLGCLCGVLSIAVYTYMPIPMTLMVSWVVGHILTGLGAGAILGFVFKSK